MSEWKKVRLGEVAEFLNGKSKPKEPGIIPIYGSNGVIGFSNRSLYANAIIVGRVGAYAGSIARCKTDFWPTDNTIIVKPRDGQVDIDFVFYRLQKLSLSSLLGGSAQPLITHGILKDKEFFLPPLATQRKIAAVLSSLDDKIENNRKICANLEAQAQAIFKNFDLVKDEVQFTSLINILSGGTPKTSEPSYWGGDIPFFSPKDVGEPFAIHTDRTITKDGLDNCNSGFYLKDTTFVTARGTVGKVCMAGVPMAMNQSCFALTSDVIDPLLVYYYTKASIDSLRSKANGSVFDAITIAEFETERIARLKESEEREFVSIVRPMFDKILSLSFESRSLAALRDALLPKLMSGEIDVEKVEVA